ncbi:MAG: hypothetical protein Tsb002_08380 [Wenzhouxiangellaceae bacterium]
MLYAKNVEIHNIRYQEGKEYFVRFDLAGLNSDVFDHFCTLSQGDVVADNEVIFVADGTGVTTDQVDVNRMINLISIAKTMRYNVNIFTNGCVRGYGSFLYPKVIRVVLKELIE